MTKTISIKYLSGHMYEEDWEKSEYHCPSCGTKSVFVGGGDDYYGGQEFICTSCDVTFHFYCEPHSVSNSSPDKQRLEQLKS